MQRGSKKIVISATVQIMKLWQHGFFKTAHTLAAVDEYFTKSGYNFEASELAHALARATYLTRKGKKGSYAYIQKGPYIKSDHAK